MTKSPADAVHAARQETRREAEATTRQKHGISPLAEGEELSDDVSFAHLQETLSQARLEIDGGPPAGAGPAADAQLEDEFLLEEIATELPVPRDEGGASRSSSGSSPLPATSAQVAVLEVRLRDAADRDEVAHLTLTLACCYAQVAGLFVVNRGIVAGLQGLGEDLGRRIEGITVPVGAGKLFSDPIASMKPYRGGAAEDDVDNRLLRALGRIDAQERVALPIAIRGRVVNLLYADNGPDAIGETSLAALGSLCRCVAEAYERLILKRKQPTHRE
jgi:hypothetical protein